MSGSSGMTGREILRARRCVGRQLSLPQPVLLPPNQAQSVVVVIARGVSADLEAAVIGELYLGLLVVTVLDGQDYSAFFRESFKEYPANVQVCFLRSNRTSIGAIAIHQLIHIPSKRSKINARASAARTQSFLESHETESNAKTRSH